MVNYETDPGMLLPHIPLGTELDLFDGKCLVSIVGFLFDDTRMFGRLSLPLHKSFEEVNLRFYVKRTVDRELRRGVVFIKELVPSRCVTWVARAVYGENYQRIPMRHRITWNNRNQIELGGKFAYQWWHSGRWANLEATTLGELAPLTPGSLSEFVTEHYWGYSRHGKGSASVCSSSVGSSSEYRVSHPSWRTWETKTCRFEADIAGMYGTEFVACLGSAPHSSLVAEGSEVALFRGRRIV